MQEALLSMNNSYDSLLMSRIMAWHEHDMAWHDIHLPNSAFCSLCAKALPDAKTIRVPLLHSLTAIWMVVTHRLVCTFLAQIPVDF